MFKLEQPGLDVFQFGEDRNIQGPERRSQVLLISSLRLVLCPLLFFIREPVLVRTRVRIVELKPDHTIADHKFHFLEIPAFRLGNSITVIGT